jgi:NADPH:quinone reductase-like Zn-dependent oxidoreductase
MAEICNKYFTMKAAVLHQIGGIPRYDEMTDPIPGHDQQIMYVKAASIKNIDRMLVTDTHYDHYSKFPIIVGTDGVGILEDGTRIYSGGKNGMMAEQVMVNKKWFIELPDGLDDMTAAALPNPAVSAWLSLEHKGTLKKGDAVLILGATGITGRLAIQIARHLGAGKVVVMGRNRKILEKLSALGADVVIPFDHSYGQIKQVLKSETRKQPFSIVLDYLWGEPAEQVLEILSGHDLEAESHLTRWIQIGEMAGPSINLNAATLRSSAIEISGQGGGSIPNEVMSKIPSIISKIFSLAIENKITIETEMVSLKDIESVWTRKNEEGKRMVVMI